MPGYTAELIMDWSRLLQNDPNFDDNAQLYWCFQGL